MSESNSETQDHITHIETSQGYSVPLPEELGVICREKQNNIYQLTVLLKRAQNYLGAKEDEKAAMLRDIIYKLRDLSLMYPHLKEVFLDFVVNNAKSTSINGEFKTQLLLDWVERDEEIIRYIHEAEEAEEQQIGNKVRNYVNKSVGIVMRRLDEFFGFSAK